MVCTEHVLRQAMFHGCMVCTEHVLRQAMFHGCMVCTEHVLRQAMFHVALAMEQVISSVSTLVTSQHAMQSCQQLNESFTQSTVGLLESTE